MLKLGLWMIRPCDVVAVARDGGHVGVRTRGGETISAKLEPSEACAAEQAMLSAMTDPWRPGAHEEERVAVGGERQFCAQNRRPPDVCLSPGWACAPGAAGRWLAAGMVPVTDYSGDHPATFTDTVWVRWLVPVQP